MSRLSVYSSGLNCTGILSPVTAFVSRAFSSDIALAPTPFRFVRDKRALGARASGARSDGDRRVQSSVGRNSSLPSASRAPWGGLCVTQAARSGAFDENGQRGHAAKRALPGLSAPELVARPGAAQETRDAVG